jgi:4-amino-4-deoxy-L-arabinose transferase-like glycosyltransferase
VNVDSIFTISPDRAPFQMVEPWFDKPPLFPLIIGGYETSKGINNFLESSTGIIRRPMLKIALITTLLIFLLASRWFGIRVGILSALLYSIIPTFVISSRLALSENGFIPLFLGGLYFTDLFLTKKKNIYLVLMGLMASLSLLMKMSGVAVLLSEILILLFYLPRSKKKFKDIAVLSLIGLSGLAVYCLYGYFLDWSTFIKVQFTQSNLFYGAGAEALFSAIVSSKIALKYLTDGWILLGWISLLFLSMTKFTKDRGITFLTIGTFCYLIVFLFFGSESYGWYRFPFFPFLAIALAEVINQLYKKGNLFVFSVFALIPFGTGLQRIFGQLGFQPIVIYFRLAILFLALLFSVRLVTGGMWINRLEKVAMVLVFLLLVYISIREIVFLNYDHWFFVT